MSIKAIDPNVNIIAMRKDGKNYGMCCAWCTQAAEDNPGFEVVERSTHYEEVKAAVDAAKARGVEIWQSNFKIAPERVTLEKYFQIKV